MKRLLPCALATAAALVAYHVAGRVLDGRDIIQALLAGDYFSTGAVAVVLLGSRLFLYLLAPGWALHELVKLCVERLRARNSSPRRSR